MNSTLCIICRNRSKFYESYIVVEQMTVKICHEASCLKTKCFSYFYVLISFADNIVVADGRMFGLLNP